MAGGRPALLLTVMIGLASSFPAPLDAQWRVDAQAGRLHYEMAPDVSSTSVGIGLIHQTFHSEFAASVGVPLSSEEPVWGALHGSRRLVSTGALRFGADLAGNAFGYALERPDTTTLPLPSDGDLSTGWGLSLEAMPLVAWSGGAFAAEARAGGVFFMTRADDTDGYDRAALVTDAALAAMPAPGLSLRIEGAWVGAEGGSFPYAGVAASWSPSVTIWGSLGKWLHDDIETMSWSAGLSIPFGERLAARVTGRHDALDPVYATPARTTWGAGLSLLLGDASSGIAEPVPAAYRGGVATIVLDADDADGRPSIAGDFNGWTPAPMTRRGDDWVYEVPVAPGVYNYAFVAEAGTWFVPEGTPGRRDDGMGGHVAVLVVDE
jgi:hypothetical protein